MKYLAGILLLATVGLCREACQQRKFDHDTFVCVCNVTHCDDLDPIKKTDKGVVTVYQTSRDGDRFKQLDLKFGYKHSEQTSKTETITIDKSKKVQTMIGFGGSFTDATGYMISQLPDQLQDRIIKDYFSESGIEYNLNRLPIAGADFSLRPYTYDDDHDGDFNLDHFALADEDHKYKIPYMKKAKEVSPHTLKFFGSPWAAPAWMKNNSEIHHGGYLKGDVNGDDKYYKTWAMYYVKFLEAYKKEGLDIWGLTIENEPSAGNNKDYSFNSLGFTKEIERDFIKKQLGPTLQAAGYGPNKTQVMIFDDQRDVIQEWCQTIYSDADASKYAAGCAFHFYQNHDDNVQNLDKCHQVNERKFIINSESSYGAIELGNWWFLEQFAKDIIIDVNHWVAGYVQWNMVLDQKGGPNWAKLTCNAPIIANPAAKEYYKQPQFYGFGHFSKFVTPGSVRLDHGHTLNNNNLLTAVFQRPDNGIVVVVLNMSDDTIEYNIVESGQTLSDAIKSHTIKSYIFYD